MTTKKNIAIIGGGNSSEFDISMKSAKAVFQNIDNEKYNAFLIQLKSYEWKVLNEPYSDIQIDKNDFSIIIENSKITFDCIFSLIHGTPGENGLLQGYFEMFDIPYIGSGVLASSLTFNKYYCNTYLKNSNINVNIAESVLVRNGINYNENEIITKTGLPCFVKPNAGGSSFGITKVKVKDELNSAIKHAFEESDEIIIEQFIEGDEIQCGLYKTKCEITVLPLVEIVSKNEFFDYQAKYDPNFSDEIIPARIPEDLTKKCQDIASVLFTEINCNGIVRMDFILKDREFWFLEANTIPGMTNESIVPQMIRKAGMTLKDVNTLLIENVINA